MATVKSSRRTRPALEDAAARLDHLYGNALILRSPALWERYHEAVGMAQTLGFTVHRDGARHRVVPC